MHRYVAYLRTPRSQPLTIRQYNVRHSELLDEDRQFEHACLQAWQAGAAQRRCNAVLTNAFPTPPAMLTVQDTARFVSAPNTVTIAQWGAAPKQRVLDKADVAAMRFFAENAHAGVPERLREWIPDTSARAVAAFLHTLDHGATGANHKAVLRLPPSL